MKQELSAAGERYNDRWQRIPLKRVAELIEEGRTVEEIAEVFAVPTAKAVNWCWRARKEGLAPPKLKAGASGFYYIDNRARRHAGVPPGSMVNVLGPLDEPMLNWLIQQTPDGATVADTIRAIVIDAYQEENS